MSDDASLTDFAGSEDGADGDEEDDPDRPNGPAGTDDPDDGADESGSPDAETVGPPAFTYTSTPDGAACAACGAAVEKRWRAGEGGAARAPDLDPDALVCPDCKEW